MKDFGRILTAMVTPFKKDMSVDYKKAQELALKLLEEGSDGLVLHGTTGESPTLTHEEENNLYRAVKEAVGKKGAIIAGTGSNSTAEAIEATKKAEGVGVDGAMIVVPYYNKPPQEGLYMHFKAVADSTKLPLIIYNIPGRTGKNMEPETVARLSKIKNYTAIKEASGDLEQVSKIRAMTPKDFVIYSGDDNLTLPIMERGGYGVISVASHVAGRSMREMVDAFVSGDRDRAGEINIRMVPLFKVLFITTNPIPVKAALALAGFDAGIPRLPLVPATVEETGQIKKVMKELGII